MVFPDRVAIVTDKQTIILLKASLFASSGTAVKRLEYFIT